MRVHECPKCGGESVRIRRRLIDRLHGVFLPARRFRCSAMQCQYEGNVRRTVTAKRRLALTSVALLGALLVGALAMDTDLHFASHAPAYTEVSDADASLVEYWVDPRLFHGLAALPAQSFLLDLQHEQLGAAAGTK